MSNHKNYYLISLGCAKNTVDSESMGELLVRAGYMRVSRPSHAGLLIVNTCGFIKTACDESISVLKSLEKKKRVGQLLIAAGCLSQRYRENLCKLVPGIDGIISTNYWMDIVDFIQNLRNNLSLSHAKYYLPEGPRINQIENGVIRAAIQGGSAYLKIADGCRRQCAFCAIPLIKGTTISRDRKSIINDALALQNIGIQELIIIAQDTTDYGFDLGLKDGLASLLNSLINEVPNIPWLRIMYAYPGYITDKLIQTMALYPQILHYIDIPLQHANPDILQRMNRPSNINWVYQIVEKLRLAMPDLTLRTTFIVGFPGETEKEFQSLLDFVGEIKFDHVGVFTYSAEAGTDSYLLGDSISDEVKQERFSRLMLLQETISKSHNQNLIGKKLDILVEGRDKNISIGRSYRDAPEIDGLVLIEGIADIGKIIPVQITGALTHDLIGKSLLEVT